MLLGSMNEPRTALLI